MPRRARLVLLFGLACCGASIAGQARAAGPEFNPVRMHPVAIGPETHRLIVGFLATPDNAVTKTVMSRTRGRRYSITQAQTSGADVTALAQRVGLNLTRSRQFTPSMHVLFLQKTLYGADVLTVLGKLRADPALQFADVDALRYPVLVPANPLFGPTPGVASGQWYLNTPGPQTVEGVQTTDLAATDAVSAWNITTGSPGIVIADVDTGVLFDHPDLLRAGLGGRLLPGYDFVGPDYNPKSPYNALGTFDIANDGDGWDPDPSDPGDWISQADIDNPNQLFANDAVSNSSWHGTRVVGVFGAITDNNVGTAGMTWGSPSRPGPWVLPVRALGKGGGYDSDIIAGIEWAAGMTVTHSAGPAVPDNPYPADIINLSLAGESSCSSDYQTALATVTGMGVLVVASAGNSVTPVTGTSSVEAPANCSASVPGMIAVAGLRNVGTKVGYSSAGPEIGVGAPAGNCINSTGACLRSIDTTTDLGTTVALSGSGYSYTNETNESVGTSFSAPIVSGIAALMRSVNNNLTPEQLVARIQASATPYPPNTGWSPGVSNFGSGHRSMLLPIIRPMRRRHGECLPRGAGRATADRRHRDPRRGRPGQRIRCQRQRCRLQHQCGACGAAPHRLLSLDGQSGEHHRERRADAASHGKSHGRDADIDGDGLCRECRRGNRHAHRKLGDQHRAHIRGHQRHGMPGQVEREPVRANRCGDLFPGERRRERGLHAGDHLVESKRLHAHPIELQRDAARQSADCNHARAGDDLYGRGYVADEYHDVAQAERRPHTGERQLHDHGADRWRVGRKLRERDSGASLEHRARRRK